MEKQMSLGNWILTFLITCIPVVGFIMLFVWAFGQSTQASKKTWAQAALIGFAIMFVFYFILGAVFFASVGSVL